MEVDFQTHDKRESSLAHYYLDIYNYKLEKNIYLNFLNNVCINYFLKTHQFNPLKSVLMGNEEVKRVCLDNGKMGVGLELVNESGLGLNIKMEEGE